MTLTNSPVYQFKLIFPNDLCLYIFGIHNDDCIVRIGVQFNVLHNCWIRFFHLNVKWGIILPTCKIVGENKEMSNGYFSILVFQLSALN